MGYFGIHEYFKLLLVLFHWILVHSNVYPSSMYYKKPDSVSD